MGNMYTQLEGIQHGCPKGPVASLLNCAINSPPTLSNMLGYNYWSGFLVVYCLFLKGSKIRLFCIIFYLACLFTFDNEFFACSEHTTDKKIDDDC